ncbi:MAG: biotin/lipoyl-binding protein [Planctomycetales bacterium]
MKILTWGIPLVAMVCLGFGAASSMMLTPQEQLSTPANPPAVTSLGSGTVAGLGTVEPLNERVAISPQVTGVVAKVKIVAGQKVKQGDLLFSLDDRELRADLAVQQRQQELMEAKLKKLRAGTRPEDLPPARAKVESARAGTRAKISPGLNRSGRRG